MSHTYETFVDIREYMSNTNNSLLRILSARYEVDADSVRIADDTARHRAEQDYPKATEFDVRVTRILC